MFAVTLVNFLSYFDKVFEGDISVQLNTHLVFCHIVHTLLYAHFRAKPKKQHECQNVLLRDMYYSDDRASKLRWAHEGKEACQKTEGISEHGGRGSDISG